MVMLSAGEMARDDAIAAQSITFPTWLFEPDDHARPRKLADVPAGSRPAQIRGWYRFYWEYGLDVHPLGGEAAEEYWWQHKYKMPAAKEVLSRLRYDDAHDAAEYRVVFGGERNNGNGTEEEDSVGLPEWYDDVEGRLQQRPVARIERGWDRVPLWDARRRIDLLGDPRLRDACVVNGLAVPVASARELTDRARPALMDERHRPLRALFHFADEQGGVCRGVVFNGKAHRSRGIIRNADFKYNNQFLAGTQYEFASMQEKLELFRKEGP